MMPRAFGKRAKSSSADIPCLGYRSRPDGVHREEDVEIEKA